MQLPTQQNMPTVNKDGTHSTAAIQKPQSHFLPSQLTKAHTSYSKYLLFFLMNKKMIMINVYKYAYTKMKKITLII